MRILFLDDERVRFNTYCGREPDCEIEWVRDPYVAVRRARESAFDLVSLDHDLEIFIGSRHWPERALEVTGLVAAEQLAEDAGKSAAALFVVHSWNPAGAERMEQVLRAAGLRVTRKPF